MANLLSTAVFDVETPDEPARRLTLPGVLAALSRNERLTFPALRPHQAPTWHVFLVQLGYLALEASDRLQAPSLPTEEETWAGALRALTPDWPGDEPWSLVAPPEAPAFLQPPAPDYSAAKFKAAFEAPDDLDMLITSKNHDLKGARASAPDAEDWVFALISLQTQEGFGGSGNYGVARMNGGYGARPVVSLAPRGGLSRFARDLSVLQANRNALRSDASPFSGELGPTWLEPWTGETSLGIDRLHPLCIEVCRRVRLSESGGRLIARFATSSAPRIQTKFGGEDGDLNGVVGDPWIPTHKTEHKALSITEAGFDWRQCKKLMFDADGAWTMPRLAKTGRVDYAPDLVLTMSSLARGQGKTEGFHHREIIIPPGIEAVFDEAGEARAQWAEWANAHAEDAATMANKVLKPALLVVFEKDPHDDSGKSSVSFDNKSAVAAAERFLDLFDAEVDRAFFPALWEDAEAPAEARRLAWRRQIKDFAEKTLQRGLEAGPQSEHRRYVAQARAHARFYGGLRKNFPDIFEPSKEDGADERV